MTIYEIKRLTANTAPYFFSRETMRFFGQTLRSFQVHKEPDGRFRISAKSGSNWDGSHETVRFFNPKSNELDLI